MATYDFSDSQVAALVRNTHTPVEIAADGSAMDVVPVAPATPRALKIICNRDYEPWPCAAVTDLRVSDVAAAIKNRSQQQQERQGGNRTPIPTAADQALANRRG